jgi:hypothetical protein
VSVQQQGGNCQQGTGLLLLFIPQITDGNVVAADTTKTAGVRVSTAITRQAIEVCQTVREPNCSRTFWKKLEFAKFKLFS